MELERIFVEQLSEMLDAEKQLVGALPGLAQTAVSEELRVAIEEHLHQTKEHVVRLEQVFDALDEVVRTGKRNETMKALLDEASRYADEAHLRKGGGSRAPSPEPESAFNAALDAALIGAAQKIEHYEIATYGTLTAWAKVLEEEDAVGLLQETLEEEKAIDEELTDLAQRRINPDAASDQTPPKT